jgi:hypothetical protein
MYNFYLKRALNLVYDNKQGFTDFHEFITNKTKFSKQDLEKIENFKTKMRSKPILRDSSIDGILIVNGKTITKEMFKFNEKKNLNKKEMLVLFKTKIKFTTKRLPYGNIFCHNTMEVDYELKDYLFFNKGKITNICQDWKDVSGMEHAIKEEFFKRCDVLTQFKKYKILYESIISRKERLSFLCK